MGRVVVAHAGALGDFVLALPAVSALRDAFPRAEFVLLGRSEHAFLVERLFAFKGCRDVRRSELSCLFGTAEPGAEVSAWLAGLDLAVSWLGEPEAHVNRRLAQLGVRRVVAAEPFPPAGRIVHVSDYLLETLRPLGVAGGARPLRLDIAAGVRGFDLDEALTRAGWAGRGDLVVVQPGSGGRKKCWPAERFADVAGHMARRLRAEVCLLLGPAEEDRDEFVEPFGRGALVVRAWSLEQVASLLSRRAALYLGNDSGITHLAALCGTPTVATFGPTDARVWGPRGARVRTVCAPGGVLGNLATDAVRRAAEELPAGGLSS